eukprot:CAMPEP_0170540342 /NCGR_PEP_ID=MMETSP0211-20121228/352_1 /TAXON_ID=311385 /ORGANISM="Pseudokeronopsis sp., Strain OXSARD2" /LENGTH=62 /DNA_ID=CAMNT_0010842705 /DNA_START=351 /DNA_END=539 /DNA_ORIENTATION=+
MAPQQEYSIVVSELDLNVNDTMLYQAFKKKFNSVLSAKVVIDSISRKSKGYGFVKFTNLEEF